MNGNLSLAELDDRIAILRGQPSAACEQAAAASGSQNEEGSRTVSATDRRTSISSFWSAIAVQRNNPI